MSSKSLYLKDKYVNRADYLNFDSDELVFG